MQFELMSLSSVVVREWEEHPSIHPCTWRVWKKEAATYISSHIVLPYAKSTSTQEVWHPHIDQLPNHTLLWTYMCWHTLGSCHWPCLSVHHVCTYKQNAHRSKRQMGSPFTCGMDAHYGKNCDAALTEHPCQRSSQTTQVEHYACICRTLKVGHINQLAENVWWPGSILVPSNWRLSGRKTEKDMPESLEKLQVLTLMR